MGERQVIDDCLEYMRKQREESQQIGEAEAERALAADLVLQKQRQTKRDLITEEDDLVNTLRRNLQLSDMSHHVNALKHKLARDEKVLELKKQLATVLSGKLYTDGTLELFIVHTITRWMVENREATGMTYSSENVPCSKSAPGSRPRPRPSEDRHQSTEGDPLGILQNEVLQALERVGRTGARGAQLRGKTLGRERQLAQERRRHSCVR